jgi:hypothetical protein
LLAGIPLQLLIQLTSNKAKRSAAAAAILASANKESRLVADIIKAKSAKIEPNHKYLLAVLHDVLNYLSDDANNILKRYGGELFGAAHLGGVLASLDENRIGENPPVALGVHIDAQKYLFELKDEFDNDDEKLLQFAKIRCIDHAFFVVRAGKLLA